MINFKHLAQVEESYIAHFKFGLWAGVTLIFLGFVSIVHAIFPFLFTRKPDQIYRYFVAKSESRIKRVTQILKSKNLE
jgi:hypothetical protein